MTPEYTNYLFIGIGLVALFIFMYSELSFRTKPVLEAKLSEKEKETMTDSLIHFHNTSEQIQVFHDKNITSLFDESGIHITKEHTLDIGDAVQLSHNKGKSTLSYDSLSFLQNKKNMSLYLDHYGNVGIATSTPRVELDVNGGIMCSSLQVQDIDIEVLAKKVDMLQRQLDDQKEEFEKKLAMLQQQFQQQLPLKKGVSRNNYAL